MSEPAAETASGPFANMRFRIAIEGMAETGATEVILPEGRILRSARKAKVIQYSNLTIRRGLTLSLDWYEWWGMARRAKRPPERTIRISLHNAGDAKALDWMFIGAVPIAYRLSPLNALGNEAVTEILELTVAHFEMMCSTPP
jgi:phage tail-like protein